MKLRPCKNSQLQQRVQSIAELANVSNEMKIGLMEDAQGGGTFSNSVHGVLAFGVGVVVSTAFLLAIFTSY